MNPFSSAVNQKIYFARLLLNAGKSTVDSPIHLELAMSQSAVFQLNCAYQLYLNEIATNYRAATEPPIMTATQLCEALVVIDKHPAEAQEMSNLSRQSGSWLNLLLSNHESILDSLSLADSNAVSAERNVSDERSQSNEREESNEAVRIPLQPIDNPANSLSYPLIEQIIDGFSELIERQRELMIEC